MSASSSAAMRSAFSPCSSLLSLPSALMVRPLAASSDRADSRSRLTHSAAARSSSRLVSRAGAPAAPAWVGGGDGGMRTRAFGCLQTVGTPAGGHTASSAQGARRARDSAPLECNHLVHVTGVVAAGRQRRRRAGQRLRRRWRQHGGAHNRTVAPASPAAACSAAAAAAARTVAAGGRVAAIAAAVAAAARAAATARGAAAARGGATAPRAGAARGR
ncbi:MAG: hypothetical protein J3K34DRAFT_418079 [Monoraphidium minutum]|nr:MAG: hypothetical protein J3K34DRAFT_418079 [Monoraphidium minutum]